MTDKTERERKIIEQVEHYFGDANIIRDKFLQRQIRQNTDGWVTIKVLLTFNRLAALSSDAAVIAEAVRKSDEGLVQVSEDNTKIRRHPERPMPELNLARQRDVLSRSAYAKGFPLDITMDELLEYFNNFEKVDRIHLRKYYHKGTDTYKFKGSVFVTFEKLEDAKYFIEEANPKYNNNYLIVKWQEKYLKEKR